MHFPFFSVSSRVSDGTGQCSATFRDSRTEVPSLSRDKGTTVQAKNLAKRDRTGRVNQNSGWDRPGQPKTGMGRGTKRDRAVCPEMSRPVETLVSRLDYGFSFSRIFTASKGQYTYLETSPKNKQVNLFFYPDDLEVHT